MVSIASRTVKGRFLSSRRMVKPDSLTARGRILGALSLIFAESGRRYGLDDREPATLAELGDELDISRERVRQLQREAERILKGGEYGRVLRDAVA